MLDLRDGWDNEEWGSLEEEPVRRIFLSNFYVVDTAFIYRLQNEESVDIKEDLPKDVSNELTNHNNISPSSNNSNTNWNNDTWADGEFEPINEDTFTGR